ncbi:alkane 1-monooxygenase [Gemmobacter lutimaris]|uniref:Alkane 1-monooxygenase n=1 Tax=Gemmobacter lutimaris TaxID=2306023 RepID=A0A398BW34_9RHOB|nr:alkane 1-monooxygenase [Gemmobacter lutimaris]RID93924.1 alkane 1-monooxygenase [Gemmobacter lutimaris]
MALFAVAATTPFVLLGLGVWAGGGWVWLGLVYMAVLTAVLDRLIPWVAPDAPEGAEFPAADLLLALIGAAHLLAFPLAVWAIAGGSDLPIWARIVLFLGFGQMFGQVSNPAAHELIHRGNRGLFRLGMAVYVTLLNGHHTSAHRLVHHRHVATAGDPNSARNGESFYHFLPRAYFGSFRAGLRAENTRHKHTFFRHPYILYVTGGLGCLGLGYALAGWAGLAVWLLLAAYSTAQLMLSDYVQHYGLTRRLLPDGRPEPVGPRHSWNAPQWFSSGVMLNAPRHSDHHAHPSRPYPALRLPDRDEAPWLPHSLPVCGAIALLPRRWRRMMRPHLAHWQETTAPSGQAGVPIKRA